MSCADLRLDEYFDRELGAADREAVERHLEGCADCRLELERSRNLEGLLRSVPSGAAPEAQRFLKSVRARSRGPVWRWPAAAAALLVAAVLVLSAREKGGVDVAAELARYAADPSPLIEARVGSAGPAALEELERALYSPDVKLQFAAASLLFRLVGKTQRDLILARYEQRKTPAASWTLGEPGTEDEDSEMVPVAVSLAVDGQERLALDVLQKLNRLSLHAQRKIIDSVVTLLHSTNVDIQRHALEIVKQLDIEFPLTAIVELLDSPELGEEALRFLRRETRKDFGKDKQAWLKVVGP